MRDRSAAVVAVVPEETEQEELPGAYQGVAQSQKLAVWLTRAGQLLCPLLLLATLGALVGWRRSAHETEKLGEIAVQLARGAQVLDARAALLQARLPGQEWRALLRALHAARPVRLSGLPNPPRGVAPAPEETTAALRELVAQAPFRLDPDARLLVGAQRLLHVSYSSDGETSATTDDGGDIHLWHTRDGRRLRTIAGAQAAGVTLMPDGSRLLSSSPEGARIYQVADGRLLHTLSADAPLALLALSPDGARVAGCDASAAITLWSTASGQRVATLPGEDKPVNARDLRFSPDGHLLAVQDRRAFVRLWDLRQQTQVALAEPLGLIAFSGDGQRLLTGGRQGPLQLRDGGGQIIGRLPLPERSLVADLALSPDGALALVMLGDNFQGPTLAFTTASGELRYTLEGVGAVAFADDGRHSIGWGPKASAVVWDAASGDMLGSRPRDQNAPAHTLEALRSLAAGVRSEWVWLSQASGELAQLRTSWPSSLVLAYAPSGALIASADSDGQVRLWDARSQRLLGALPGNLRAIQALRFSADGARLLAVNRERRVMLWSVADRTTLHSGTLPSAQGRPHSLVIAPDLQRVAALTATSVELFAVTRSELLSRRDAADERAAITAAAFSADGQRLALGARGALWLQDLAVDAAPRRYAAPFGDLPPRTLVFSPAADDQDEIFIGAGECGWVLSLASGASASPVCRSGEQALMAHFVKGQIQVASGGAFQTLALWDGRSGRTLLTLPRSYEGVVALAPSGRELLQRGAQGTPVVWSLPQAGAAGPLGAVADACHLVERMTRAWSRDLPEGARSANEVTAICRR